MQSNSFMDLENSPSFKIIDFFSSNLLKSIEYDDLCIFLESENISLKDFRLKFIDGNLACIENDSVYLNYYDPYIRSLKLFRDAYHFNSLPQSFRIEINNAIEDLTEYFKNNLLAIFLIGSAARKTISNCSDIDYFVITGRKKDFNHSSIFIKNQFIIRSKAEFEQDFQEGEELAIWTLKYGLLLRESHYIFDYFKHKEIFVGHKHIYNKLKTINKLENQISKDKFNSTQVMRSQIRKMAYQMARFVLLQNNEMPLSKSEILYQLDKYDHNLSTKIKTLEKSSDLTKNELLKLFYELKNCFRKLSNNDFNFS